MAPRAYALPKRPEAYFICGLILCAPPLKEPSIVSYLDSWLASVSLGVRFCSWRFVRTDHVVSVMLADDTRSYTVNPKNSMHCMTHVRGMNVSSTNSSPRPGSSMPWFITMKLTSEPDEASVNNTTQVCERLNTIVDVFNV